MNYPRCVQHLIMPADVTSHKMQDFVLLLLLFWQWSPWKSELLGRCSVATAIGWNPPGQHICNTGNRTCTCHNVWLIYLNVLIMCPTTIISRVQRNYDLLSKCELNRYSLFILQYSESPQVRIIFLLHVFHPYPRFVHCFAFTAS